MAAVLLSGAIGSSQTLRDALYPTDETRRSVCEAVRGKSTEDVRFLEAVVVDRRDSERSPFGVSIASPLFPMAYRCVVNSDPTYWLSTDEILERQPGDYVSVTVFREIPNMLHAVNNYAALVAIDEAGNEFARLHPDPFESTLVDELPFRTAGWRTAEMWDSFSQFVFKIGDDEFRAALDTASSLRLLWKAGTMYSGEWDWPIGFGDCTGELLSECLLHTF